MYGIRYKGVALLAMLALVFLCVIFSGPSEVKADVTSLYSTHNANLAGLSISSVSLSPGFSPDIMVYTGTIDSAIGHVTVSPTAVNPLASIKVNGISVSSGSSSAPIYLNSGSNSISIVVTSEDRTNQKVYTVNINKSSNYAYLSSLWISGGSLDQSFSPTRTSYTATVYVSSITVTAIPEDSNASVYVDGSRVYYGDESQTIYLKSGSNEIDIRVMSSYGSSMVYYIVVTRSGGGSDIDVDTNSPTGITTHSATLNGSIGYSYYDDFSKYGFAYSTDQSDWSNVTVGYSDHSGSFSYNLSGLGANTKYYYKAYVYDYEDGYTYGNTVSFRTKSGSSTTVSKPTITPSGGTYYTGQTVKIGNISSGCTAYYSTDGSNPTSSSTAKRYSSPFTISSSKVVKAAVYDNSENVWSSVTTANYTITTNNYSYTPNPNIYTTPNTSTYTNTTPNTSSYTKTSFGDVPSGYWAYNIINTLKSQGYVSGYPDATFHPDDSISRAEITTIISNVLRIYLYDSNTRHFYDVAPADWYYVPVEKAYQKGIVSGKGGYFRPNQAITREELAAILVNALGKSSEAQANMYEQSNFNDDSRISSWARGFVVTAVKYGLITGYPGSNNFAPQDSATRAEACGMITSFLSKYSYGYGYSY